MTRGISEKKLKEIMDLCTNDIGSNIVAVIISQCEELNPWLPIEQAPKGAPGFLALSKKRDSIAWLINDQAHDDRFYNQNTGNYTDKSHWTHYQELPEDPKEYV